MQKIQIKIFKGNTGKLILGLITIGLIFIGGIICFAFRQYTGGIIIIVVGLIPLLCVLLSSFWVIFDNEKIKMKSFFGKIKKEEKWSDLKSVIIKRISNNVRDDDYYIILNFLDVVDNFKKYEDINEAEHTIYFVYTPKREELLKRYTDVPIIDKRMSAK